MAVSVNTIPSVGIPLTDKEGRINPIWHEFLRAFVSESVQGTIVDSTNTKSVTAGAGLTGGGIGEVTLNVGAGNGITVNADNVNVDINNQSIIQAATEDELLISDVSDNNTIRKTKVSDIVDLVEAGAQYSPDGTVGTDNVIVGNGAGDSIASGGDFNTAVGKDAMTDLTTGDYNTAVGYQAGQNITANNHNVIMGSRAGSGTLSINNTVAIGSVALNGSLLGISDQTVVGYQAGSRGSKNVHLGYQAGGGFNTTQRDNQVGVGYLALAGRSGTGNVGVGYQAGKSGGAGAVAGDSNTFVGNNTGATATTGDNNTLIGNGADKSAATVGDEFTLGNSSVATLRCQQTSITALSDRRDKKDIENLQLGLDFINDLRPVKFTWNMRDGGKVGDLEAGFIAQELQEASEDHGAEWVGLVLKSNPERLEASPGKLIPIIVKAIQELYDSTYIERKTDQRDDKRLLQ